MTLTTPRREESVYCEILHRAVGSNGRVGEQCIQIIVAKPEKKTH
jgi:hypothetical protein